MDTIKSNLEQKAADYANVYLGRIEEHTDHFETLKKLFLKGAEEAFSLVCSSQNIEEKSEVVHQILQDNWYVVVSLDPTKRQGWYLGDIPDNETEAYKLFSGVLDIINRTYKTKFNRDLIKLKNDSKII
ncbi:MULTISPECIES: hypothetical protein [Bacteroidales]|jgi:metal-dependent hydrolase (beta-lactamase superfamily II)|nr:MULTISPECIES: hypothetical protein [Bacteroidales]RLT77071.1 hypothetical protein D7V95_04950 [bacterium J10(2018)]ROT11866.1 hypothetical protein EEL49_00045 [Muribaculaceae bacterium Isolate-104 (HZI)]ROT14516.1 hypothetical protein EEL50_07140 [Muribaculaceae bacterium Isolate-105 (HZI)]RXE63364.1 hypothetical protein ED375_00515 [Muribaculaceae bacterium Isolate-004 (NCI)]